MNRSEFSKAYGDKSMYNLWFPSVKLPNTIIKNINGIYYNKDFDVLNNNEVKEKVTNNKKLIIKTSIESGGGKNITVLNDKLHENRMKIINDFRKNFVVQEFINQHDV